MMRIGFIGGGNMATAIAVGANKKKRIAQKEIYIFDKEMEKAANQ